MTVVLECIGYTVGLSTVDVSNDGVDILSSLMQGSIVFKAENEQSKTVSCQFPVIPDIIKSRSASTGTEKFW